MSPVVDADVHSERDAARDDHFEDEDVGEKGEPPGKSGLPYELKTILADPFTGGSRPDDSGSDPSGQTHFRPSTRGIVVVELNLDALEGIDPGRVRGLPGLDRGEPRKDVADLVGAGQDHRPREGVDLEVERLAVRAE